MMAKTKWLKKRHTIARNILYFFLYPYSKIKYGITAEKFKEQNGRQYLVLFNHQTAFDQFFVGFSFSGPVYYLASEDLFSKGWISSVIRYLVAPIPIKKQTGDVGAVRNCIRVAKEGATIALSPEGNRTYSGKTEYMSSSIASLARVLKLPIALYRIEGGYGTHPRWSDVVRKGKMRSYVAEVIEPEQIAELTDDELFELIQKGLYVNEANDKNEFHHKKRAEYLERAIYVCPFCGLSKFISHNHIIECQNCERRVIYNPDTTLSGVGFEHPFRFVNDWYEYQKQIVNGLDLGEYTEDKLFTDIAQLSEVIVYKNKKPISPKVSISLYGDRIVINENSDDMMVFPFKDTSAVTVLGKNKLNIYYGKTVYQLKGDKHFNALKYVNIFNRFLNMSKEDKADEQFLGL